MDREAVLVVTPCRDRAGFKATPTRRFHLDLNKAVQVLQRTRGFNVMVSTPHVVIVRLVRGDAEVTIYKSGDMLVKKVQTSDEARGVAHAILHVLREATS